MLRDIIESASLVEKQLPMPVAPTDGEIEEQVPESDVIPSLPEESKKEVDLYQDLIEEANIEDELAR